MLLVFLKSTDDSMLDTLQKMAGVTHRTRVNGKSVTVDKERLMLQNKGEITYNVNTSEEPLITFNDMAFLPNRNSIVFRAGGGPIWNRNQTILPMSWRLFSNTIQHAGHDYSLQTIPTLSTAMDFDVRKNQPDFSAMLQKRMNQAEFADDAKERYQDAYEYSDYEVSRLDPDVLSDDIMDIINAMVRIDNGSDGSYDDEDEAALAARYAEKAASFETEENTAVTEAAAKSQAELAERSRPRYASGALSREDLISLTAGVQHTYDSTFAAAFRECKNKMFKDQVHFLADQQGGLLSSDGTPYIICNSRREAADLDKIENAAKDPNSRTYMQSSGGGEEDTIDMSSLFTIKDEFYKFLVECEDWKDIASGAFEQAVIKALNISR